MSHYDDFSLSGAYSNKMTDIDVIVEKPDDNCTQAQQFPQKTFQDGYQMWQWPLISPLSKLALVIWVMMTVVPKICVNPCQHGASICVAQFKIDLFLTATYHSRNLTSEHYCRTQRGKGMRRRYGAPVLSRSAIVITFGQHALHVFELTGKKWHCYHCTSFGFWSAVWCDCADRWAVAPSPTMLMDLSALNHSHVT